MKTSEIRLGFSPMTKKIYAGKMNRTGVWIDKKDVTNDFIYSLLLFGEAKNNHFDITSNGKVTHEVIIKSVKEEKINGCNINKELSKGTSQES